MFAVWVRRKMVIARLRRRRRLRAQWRQAFEDGARQLGFTRITSVRPEVAAAAVTTLLAKGRP